MGSSQDPKITFRGPMFDTVADAAGPFSLLPHVKSTEVKKYLVIIFVCHSTKFVHFELVDSATPKAFLDSLDGVRATFGDVNSLQMDPGTMFQPLSSHLGKPGFEARIFETDNGNCR